MSGLDDSEEDMSWAFAFFFVAAVLLEEEDVDSLRLRILKKSGVRISAFSWRLGGLLSTRAISERRIESQARGRGHVMLWLQVNRHPSASRF